MFHLWALPDRSVLWWRRLVHVEGGFKRKFGAFIQRSFWMNASAEVPREASSAGLDLDSTYLHCEGLESSLMIATRLATYVWKRLDSFAM